MNTVSLYGLRCANPAALADEVINGAYNVDENPMSRIRDFVESTEDVIEFDTVFWRDVDLSFKARYSSSRYPDENVLRYLQGENVTILVYHPQVMDSVYFVLNALSSHYTFQNVIIVEYNWPIEQAGHHLCENLINGEIPPVEFPIPEEQIFRVNISSSDDVERLKDYIASIFGL